MSSELFEAHKEEFKNLHDELKNKMDQQIPNYSGETKKGLIREVERGIEDANILIQEMEDEVKMAPQPYRTQMLSGVRSSRRQIDQLSRDMKKASSNVTVGRGEFGSRFEDDFASAEASQRSRLLAGTDSLTRTSQSIARSQMVSAETDQIGHETINELGEQRESLVRTKNRLTETDAHLSKSRKILNSMARRVMTNKMIVAVIILLELAILGGVTYWKFFS